MDIFFVFKSKSIEGFWLTKWISEKGFWGTYKASKQVQRLIQEGTIHTEIHAHTSLENAAQALLDYSKEMTLGKVIIRPTS